MRLLPHRNDNERAAAAAGKAAARADRRAGGFGAAHDGSDPDMTEAEAEAYNRGYQRVAPRSWYR